MNLANACDRATLDWLLEPENPAVRLLALTDLLEHSADSREVREAREAVMRVGTVPAILALQNPDGSWAKPEAFYTAKYRGTVWQLVVLAEHCADGRDERVRRAAEFLLAHSQDPVRGGFSQHAAKRASGGLPSEVIPCLTGNAVWSLIRLGYGDDGRVAQGVDWLTRHLRFDDGESSPPADWPYARLDACYGRHACFMGLAKGLKALVEIPADRQSAAVRHTIDRGAEFLLRHRVYKRSHNVRRIAKPGFTHFGFPRMYQTDALEILLLLVRIGIRDERLDDAIALVRSKRGTDGRWRLEDTFNGKFQVDIEEKGQPSKWITLHALRALKLHGLP